jgi:hypothetical protein
LSNYEREREREKERERERGEKINREQKERAEINRRSCSKREEL